MPESPIRKLAPLAAAAKNRGIKVYHLNIGQPDLPTPKVAIDAIRNIDRNILEYSPSQGYKSYRRKLVGYYKKYDIDVSADDIIITCGGSEAVLFAFLSCLNPGLFVFRQMSLFGYGIVYHDICSRYILWLIVFKAFRSRNMMYMHM